MTRLSVNVNKIATLRNTRDNNIPDLRRLSRVALDAGAQGITIHPRPDQRHIRTSDIDPLWELVREFPTAEFNMEGNPFHGHFIEQVCRVVPHQATLVPDALAQKTSDHGWRVKQNKDRLSEVVSRLHGAGVRVSLFMDHDSTEFELARAIGVDRVELYTEPYASSYARGDRSIIDSFATAAGHAQICGMGVNAGHDLNLFNLSQFLLGVPGVLEVSIGHALIADAIEYGMFSAVRRYLDACESGH